MEAKRIKIRGIVQGVGFRPFVFRIAEKYRLKGWVLNSSSSVIIHIEGESANIEKFLISLMKEKPAPAVIDDIIVEES
ncbi:MAG: acylphosphatase, partial [candidate division WOR-3 bacterium]